MSFMAQVRLSDVPGFESEDNTLISFHYCQQCAYDGKMSWGWDCCSNRSGYAVSVISEISSRKGDQLGAVAEVVIEPHIVTLLDVTEIPGYEETTNLFPETPDDYPQGEDDFDENVYPGVKHVELSKLGGWPSWVQSPNPPATVDNEGLRFIAQFDYRLSDAAPWGGPIGLARSTPARGSN